MSARIPLVIVAAVARNGVIGGGNTLPWRLSTDLRRYKALTLGRPVIMGRNTFDSIGRALPGRETIVVTRQQGWSAPGAFTAATPREALALGASRAVAMGADRAVLAGGGELFCAMLDSVDRMHITEVAAEPAGDTYFPQIDPALWRVTFREPHAAGPRDDAPFTFVDYERRRPVPEH